MDQSDPSDDLMRTYDTANGDDGLEPNRPTRELAYTFDAYIHVRAKNLDEAHDKLGQLLAIANAIPSIEIEDFDAYDISVPETEEEIRQVR